VKVMTRLLVLAVALIAVWVLLFLAGGVGTMRSGGCNHIPLVNGQPAYQCSSQP
jgi:hypothetical protein